MGIGWDPRNPFPADEYDNFVDLVSQCLDHRISFADTRARVQTMMKRYDVEDAIGLDRFLRAALELRADGPRSVGVGGALTVGADRWSLRDGHRYRPAQDRRRTAPLGLSRDGTC